MVALLDCHCRPIENIFVKLKRLSNVNIQNCYPYYHYHYVSSVISSIVEIMIVIIPSS